MQYLQDLRRSVIRIAIVLVILVIIITTFSIKILDYGQYKVVFLYPDLYHNIAVQTMALMRQDLLPNNVTLIQTSPGQAFFAQVYVASLLALILTIPIITKETISFIGPGLYQNEKTFIKKITLFSVVLFSLGCSFSYLVMIPLVLEFLYKYGEFMNIATFLDISQFVPFVLQFLIALGVSYQLPLLMWAITISGIVRPRFWRNNLRYVIIILAIFGAFVTPDGSGITMWFVAGPMILLYLVGIFVIERNTYNPTYENLA
jgi:sec-independent protein translocase protein TatC